MASTVEYIGLPDVLACGCCQRTDVSKQQLKKCGGCGAVRYCSKACQKQAWPFHKSSCRSHNSAEETGAEQAGYTAPLSLANAVKEWGNIHEDAFSTIVHSVVRSNGGVDWVLNNERCMVFYLRPLRRELDSDNPASAFEIMSLALVSKDVPDSENEPFRDHWEGPMKASRAMHTAQIAFAEPNPRFAGLLPATFIVADTEVTMHSHYRLYRPKAHADGTLVDRRILAAFEDIKNLCVYTVGAGLVLRDHPEADSSSPLPRVGCTVREKKLVWKSMSDPAAAMTMALRAGNRPRRSKLSLQALWTCWRQW
ncbi:hypothetical protein V8D89_003681 [Ganoderma adspersum]